MILFLVKRQTRVFKNNNNNMILTIARFPNQVDEFSRMCHSGIVANADNLIRSGAHQNVRELQELLVVSDVDDVHGWERECGVGCGGVEAPRRRANLAIIYILSSHKAR